MEPMMWVEHPSARQRIAETRIVRRMAACELIFVMTLAPCVASCKVGPTEPPVEEGDRDYQACPRGTSPWGRGPINPIRWWCELPDGALHGPLPQWWPSETVKGALGPQANGLRVKGWYEH